MERLKQSNAGAVLAIASGIFLLGLTTFPRPVPEGAEGDAGAVWIAVTRVLALVILGAPFLASLRPRSLGLARGALAVAGLLLIATSVVVVVLSAAGPETLLLDGVPGLLALIAAWLLRPLRRPEVERAARAEASARPRSRPPASVGSPQRPA